ncbi:hypothetical protein C8J56DRAFT_862764 [Mycena floridula]|nr:hypothetical protein C8J56DRAFT_862764 [Mycena floridula]
MPFPSSLPNELLHNILMFVMVDSIHLVCLANEDHPWELHAIATLSSVCRGFRDIISNIATRAFAIEPSSMDGLSIAITVQKKLAAIHDHAFLEIRDPPVPLSKESLDCSLIKSYALFLAIRALWENAITAPAQLFDMMQSCIQQMCFMIRGLCDTLDPPPIVTLLRRSAVELELLCQYATAIVHACSTLRDHLEQWKTVTYPTNPIFTCQTVSEKLESLPSPETVLSNIHQTLFNIETAEKRCSDFARTTVVGLGKPICIAEFTGVQQTLKTLDSIHFGESYDFPRLAVLRDLSPQVPTKSIWNLIAASI